MSAGRPLTLTVNDRARAVRAAPAETLLEVLRDQLGLTGAKRGCNQGVCGACTVLLAGRPVRSCLSLALNCADQPITTIEGLATGRQLSPLQQAVVESGAVQCGFCISGILLSATALLAANPRPSTDEVRVALSGNLCRCSGYRKIIDAVERAAAAMAA
jgi:aerobic-type carbon monoxide dehydrogenase small subunit (CoxS/CutS family)